MTDDLLPCPFCGGAASFKPRSFKASCDRCGAHVPNGAVSSDEAITAWNKRDRAFNQLIADLEAQVAMLKSDLTEARRRRDQWMAKAEGFEAIRVALREKVGSPWPPHLSRLVWAGIAADEKARADEAEAEVARLKAASVITGPGEAARILLEASDKSMPMEAKMAAVKAVIARESKCQSASVVAWQVALEELIDYPGKEVMPDVSGTARPSHDAAPASLSAGGGAGWQPIETIPARVFVVVGCWVGSRWSWWQGLASDLGCDGEYGDEPTHWMPIPAPPATKGPTDE